MWRGLSRAQQRELVERLKPGERPRSEGGRERGEAEYHAGTGQLVEDPICGLLSA
jgi:hypothetical protein